MIQSRCDADKVLTAAGIDDGRIRAFALTNLVPTTPNANAADSPLPKFQWRVNLRALIDRYESHIASFPQGLMPFDRKALFVGGENSTYLTAAHQEAIQRHFPSNDVKLIPGAGHWVRVLGMVAMSSYS